MSPAGGSPPVYPRSSTTPPPTCMEVHMHGANLNGWRSSLSRYHSSVRLVHRGGDSTRRVALLTPTQLSLSLSLHGFTTLFLLAHPLSISRPRVSKSHLRSAAPTFGPLACHDPLAAAAAAPVLVGCCVGTRLARTADGLGANHAWWPPDMVGSAIRAREEGLQLQR